MICKVLVLNFDYFFKFLNKNTVKAVAYFLRESSFSQESKCDKYGVFLLGPFTSTEMAEWFSAGYFTMNLLVKRGCDDIFQPLGELIKRWGRVPFLSGPTPPPLKVWFIFTARIRRMGNVLFSQACVCPPGRGRGSLWSLVSSSFNDVCSQDLSKCGVPQPCHWFCPTSC